jgi:hypothetical protein
MKIGCRWSAGGQGLLVAGRIEEDGRPPPWASVKRCPHAGETRRRSDAKGAALNASSLQAPARNTGQRQCVFVGLAVRTHACLHRCNGFCDLWRQASVCKAYKR